MATYFWVGTGTWDGVTNHFATTTGGTATVAAPTTADDVNFDVNSGTCTTSGTTIAKANNLNFTGYVSTFTHTAATTVQVNGNLTMATGMTYTRGNATTSVFSLSSATTSSITTNGKTMASITLAGVGTFTLQDSFTFTGGQIITSAAATFNTNGQTVNGGAMAISTAGTTLTMGASNITLSAAFTVGTTTVNAGTSTITMTGSATFTGNGKTYWNLTGTSNATLIITGNNTFNNLSRTPVAGGLPIIQFNGTTTTVNGILNFTGAAVTSPLWVAGYDANGVAGAATHTIALGTTGTIAAASFVTFSDTIITGTAAPFTGTSIGDIGNNTGITADTPRSLFWVGNTGSWSQTTHWALTSGGASGNNPPLPQDSVTVDANSITLAAQTITMDMRHPGKNVDFSAVAHTPNIAGAATQFFCGDVKCGTMTGTGTAAWVFFGKGAQTITSNGYQHNQNLQVQCTGGSYSLADNLSTAGGFLALNGTFDANNFNITASFFQSTAPSSATVRTIHLRSGTHTLTGTGTVINISSMPAGSFFAETSTMVITDTSVTTKTIAGGGVGVMWNNITITGGGTGAVVQSAGTGQTLNWTGVLTINGPKTFTWHNGFVYNSATGQTTYGTINIVGTTGNVVTMNTDLAGTRATMRLGTGSNTAAFGAFQDIYASSNMIDATNNGTDNGNNLGVIFTRTENRYEGMLGVGN